MKNNNPNITKPKKPDTKPVKEPEVEPGVQPGTPWQVPAPKVNPKPKGVFTLSPEEMAILTI